MQVHRRRKQREEHKWHQRHGLDDEGGAPAQSRCHQAAVDVTERKTLRAAIDNAQLLSLLG